MSPRPSRSRPSGRSSLPGSSRSARRPSAALSGVAQTLGTPSYAKLAVACVILALADLGNQLADAVILEGTSDEIAHLATTLIILWALGPTICRRFLVPALIASVAIDVDHVPARLGYHFLTHGTPRPYTHSLLTIVVVVLVAAVWRRRRDVLIGVGLGLAIHFFRDLTEHGSGVALLWPISDYSCSLPHAVYLAAMALSVLVVAERLRGAPLGERVIGSKSSQKFRGAHRS
ncbi:MAG TPA: metal-dependent hydrolase [Solirubrobacteraceae bacterium]